jgi:peptidoglycan/xylan/chitin deacetylase (PgdA/CDA1 family)
VNSALKNFAEHVLIASGIARIARRRLRGRTLVLAYHNVLPDGESPAGDASLHLPRREFARQLDVLEQSHEVVPIEHLSLSAPATGRQRVVITFDDAYAGALTAGVDELAKRGMPATIFVTPALLGCVAWWDTLADPTRGAVSDDLRRHALDVLGGDAESIIKWARSTSTKSRSASILPRIATDSQLAAVASKGGITLGSHSWSHPNLCALTGYDLEAELVRPLQWLRSRFTAVVPWLSYPYGLFNEAAQRAATNAGYVGAFRIEGGWMPRSPQASHAIPRLNVPSGLSIDGFRLKLAGL